MTAGNILAEFNFLKSDVVAFPKNLISTYCLSMKDMILLQKALYKKFDIETNVLLRKAGLIIYIPKSQLPKLSKIVKKYMVPSMYYKLNGNKI